MSYPKSTQFSMENYRIGVDLGQTAIKAGIVDDEGNLLNPLERESRFLTQPELLLPDLISIVNSLIETAISQSIPIVGMGLSSTLDVNTQTGCFRFIKLERLKDFSGFPIASHLASQFGLPVQVENDGIATAWGEFRAGAGKGYQNVLSITVGTGIGGGIILDGQRLSDSVGSAAYFGHMTINFDGPSCEICGQKGCWELYASGRALERQARQALEWGKTPTQLPGEPIGRDIISAAIKGDILASQLLSETGHYLGIGLANLLNIFNPEVVVIGGGLAHAGELLLTPTRETMERLRMPLRPVVDLYPAKLGAFSGVVGAALIRME
jgi:glucokinase